MKHRFYAKNKREQTKLQILIAAVAFVIVALAAVLAWISKIYLLAALIPFLVLTIIAPFFDVPSLKKSGKLVYRSLLFITEKPKNGVLKIHGGTLFDYVFVLDRKQNGKQRSKVIIQQYLEGLLVLIREYENKNLDNLTLRGTSYIINERTAQRIGFNVVKPDSLQIVILLLNYFNILLSYSLAKNKLSFPKLNDSKTFETKLNDLAQRKDYISRLNEHLKNAWIKSKN